MDEIIKQLFEPSIDDDGALTPPVAVLATKAQRIAIVMHQAFDIALLRIVRASGDALEQFPDLNQAVIEASSIVQQARSLIDEAIKANLDPAAGLDDLARHWGCGDIPEGPIQ